MLKFVDLTDNGNLLTVFVSLGVAMIVIANPSFFSVLPPSANMITLAGLSAVGLNAFFNMKR